MGQPQNLDARFVTSKFVFAISFLVIQLGLETAFADVFGCEQLFVSPQAPLSRAAEAARLENIILKVQSTSEFEAPTWTIAERTSQKQSADAIAQKWAHNQWSQSNSASPKTLIQSMAESLRLLVSGHPPQLAGEKMTGFLIAAVRWSGRFSANRTVYQIWNEVASQAKETKLGPDQVAKIQWEMAFQIQTGFSENLNTLDASSGGRHDRPYSPAAADAYDGALMILNGSANRWGTQSLLSTTTINETAFKARLEATDGLLHHGGNEPYRFARQFFDAGLMQAKDVTDLQKILAARYFLDSLSGWKSLNSEMSREYRRTIETVVRILRPIFVIQASHLNSESTSRRIAIESRVAILASIKKIRENSTAQEREAIDSAIVDLGGTP